MSAAMTTLRPAVLITGMAEGLGASIARAFAADGYDVIGLARRASSPPPAIAGGAYTYLRCDLTDAAEVAAVVAPHAERIAVLVHNAHALLIKPSLEITPGEFEQVWRVVCFGAMVAARAVLPAMLARGTGAIVFTGATASRRGGAKFSAFASAKFALRGLAQSLAREYGPRGVHVAHVVIDGLIDAAQTTQRFGPAASGRIAPDAVAAAYVGLVRQHRSAWTHELDLRPSSETF
jgi:NAD(P)-dependent dehydrogenase (short-subunit alcohol dehydrogenase family)